jgi:hypothetical protein
MWRGNTFAQRYLKILNQGGSYNAVFVFIFGKKILTVSQSNDRLSMYFYQCNQ